MFGLFGSHKKIVNLILDEFEHFYREKWTIESFEKNYNNRNEFIKQPKSETIPPDLNSECYTWVVEENGVQFQFSVSYKEDRIGNGIGCDTYEFYRNEMGGKYIGLNISGAIDGGICMKPFEDYSPHSGAQYFGNGTFQVYRLLSNDHGYRVV